MNEHLRQARPVERALRSRAGNDPGVVNKDTFADVPAVLHLDHRIAMSMAVAGLASRDGVEIDDTRPIATSFPAFEALLDGARA